MAKITYSPIKQDADGYSYSDLILTGDTFYDDAIVVLADGQRASLYVDEAKPNLATLVFDNEITGDIAVTLSADVFDSGELPTGVNATLSVDGTVVDPTDPVNPTDPVDPTDPVNPTDPDVDLVQGTIEYSTTELTEAVANDGSVAEAVTLTITGDTFYSELAGADLNDPASDFYLGDVVTGVPAGLTAHLIVSEDLKSAELTFDGNATLNEEADSATLDLSPVQVSLPSSYFESNIAAVSADQDLSIMFQDAATLTAEGSFVESAKNNSTITGKVTITLQNSSFAADLIGTDLNAADVDGNPGTYVENVPAGLTAHLTIIDATSAELTLTGTADSSNHADSINDLTYSFQATDFETGILPENSELLTTDVTFIEPSLVWDETSINDAELDGFAEQTATFKLVDGAQFVKANLNLSKFVQGLPEGVTATLIADSETEATLTVNGAPANFDVATLTLALPKLAFVGRMDVAGRDSAIELTFNDTTAPDAPTFGEVAGDNVINDQERAEGVTISGTAEAGSTITLTFSADATSSSSAAEIVDQAVLDQAILDLETARQTAADAQTALDEKTTVLADAQTALDEKTTVLTDAQTVFDDAQIVFDEAQAVVDAATTPTDAETTAAADAQTTLDTAQADIDAAQADVDTAQADFDTAQADFDTAQTALDDATTVVTAAETAVTDAGGTLETTVIDEPVVPVDAVPVTTSVPTTSGDAITVTTDADGNWSYPLAESDYPADYQALIVTAVASDAAGNLSEAASITINLEDTTAPVIELTGETDGVISGTVDDSTATVTLTVGGNERVADVADGVWSYTLGEDDYSAADAATATLSVIISAKDALGNSSNELTSDIMVPDTIAPDMVSVALVEDTGADNADNVTNKGELVITDNEQDATVEFSLDDTNWSAEQSTLALVQGENTVLVRQTDLAGNVSDNAELSFVFDTVALPVTVAISGIDATHTVTASADLTVTDFESTDAVIEYSTNSTDGTDGVWSLTEPTFVDGKNAGYVRQTDAAGNVSVGTKYDFTLVTGPTQVAVSAANTTPFDASKVANIFNVAEGDYTYNITGFSDDDAVYFPAANTASVKNSDFADGNVDLQYANNGKVALIHLSGLTPAQDAALYSINGFNTLFGADTIGIVGVTTPATTPVTTPTTPVVTTPTTSGTTSKVAVSAAGNGDALTGSNVQFDLASGNYTYTIANFGAGDILNFPDDNTATVSNSVDSVGSVDVKWANSGNNIVVTLTGLTDAQDSAIYSFNSFNTAFGAGSII